MILCRKGDEYVVKKTYKTFTALLLCFLITFGSSACVYSFSETYGVNQEIIETARSEIGYYGEESNKFNEWYYGQKSSAAWCAVFVSWCADSAGALGTAIPKRATCLSMKLWFERRNLYYTVDSGYIPQKGDIVFMNTSPDGTDSINHVEFISEDGYYVSGQDVCVSCIGGNTSDINYNGSDYVTEKIRPLKGDKAEIAGFAHPEYEKCDGIRADIYGLTDDLKTDTVKYIESKLIRIFVFFETWFVELMNSVSLLKV